jgi:hypothetical protein
MDWDQSTDCLEIRCAVCCEEISQHVAKYANMRARHMYMSCSLHSFFHPLSSSSYHHPLAFLFFPLAFSLSLRMSQSLSYDPAYDSDNPHMDFDELEDDVGETAMPPPPPPLSTDAIAWLTHNELHNNAEFIKYVNLVNVLLRTNTSPIGKFVFFCFHLFCTHSLTNTASALSLPSTLPPPSYLASPVVSHGASRCLPYPQPLQRPSEFPVSILWTLSDCKKDPKVGVSASNWSHPPMQRSI